MNEIIYLEPDSEITSVIDRIKKSDSNSVALVIPRGATLAQSIVNLKLLKKSAEGIDKDITLVSNDRISRNLASQIGLTVFSKVSEAQKAGPTKMTDLSDKIDKDDDGFQVNNYYRDKENEEVEEPDESQELEPEALETEDEEEIINEETGESPEEEIEEEKEEVVPEEADEEDKEKDGKKEMKEKKSGKEEKIDSKRTSVEDLRKPKFKLSRKPILIIVSVCVALILLASFIFVPYASISVGLKTEDLETEVPILADKTVEKSDLAKLTIPAKQLDLEKESSKDFNSTGTKDLGEKASGTVTFYNAYSSEAQTIPAGTRATSSDNKVFLTVSAVKLSGATLTNCKLINGSLVCDTTPSSVDGQLIAQNNGSDYNIAASKFVISGFNAKIYAESKTALIGGITKSVKVVTDSDLSKASDSLKEDLTKSSKAELIEKAKNDKLIISEADIKAETISESSSKKTDEESETLTYTIKMKFYVLGFSEEDLKSITKDSIIEKIGSNKMIVNPDKAEIIYKITESSVDSGIMKVTSKIVEKIGPKIDKNKIINDVKNKSVANAKSKLLSDENIASVDISVWPSFYKRIPLIKNRIKIKFDYAK